MKILHVILLLLLVSCSVNRSYERVLLDHISEDYLDILHREKGMTVYGTGAAMMDQIKTVCFDLNCPELATLEPARATTVWAVEMFLSMINKDKDIRPFLEYYPCRPTGVELFITFFPFNPQNPLDGKEYAFQVFTKNGKINYIKLDIDTDKWVDFHKETYEEAYEKVYGKPYPAYVPTTSSAFQ